MNIFFKYAALLFFLIILNSGCSVIDKIHFNSKGTPPAKEAIIFSANETIKGYKIQPDFEICRDLVCLASIIDGAAPYYISNGAKEILFCDFKNDDSEKSFSVEIYKTENLQAAEKFFNNSSSLAPEIIKINGRIAKIDNGLVGTYRLETFKERYFIRIITSKKTENLKKEMIDFTNSVLSLITD
ncbi:MAG: hypothetical protein D6734_12210 [Candidatus Schekmanbacteria bacterium]|nr:MAG: hypothetical protein D6734_12210 [Candidatus Schekmanbacteria bacterium]